VISAGACSAGRASSATAYAFTRRYRAIKPMLRMPRKKAFSKKSGPPRVAVSRAVPQILVNASLDLARRHGGRRELTDSDSVLVCLLDQVASTGRSMPRREAE
jgi:hypothetical protein